MDRRKIMCGFLIFIGIIFTLSPLSVTIWCIWTLLGNFHWLDDPLRIGVFGLILMLGLITLLCSFYGSKMLFWAIELYEDYEIEEQGDEQ